MRYLGVDYGSKNVGLALSDEAGGFAFPKETIVNDRRMVARIAEIVRVEKVGAIVVGDARSLSGGANKVTPDADRLADALKDATKLPLFRVREAFSSAEAMRFAPPHHRHDDSAAAAILLQRFLDDRPLDK